MTMVPHGKRSYFGGGASLSDPSFDIKVLEIAATDPCCNLFSLLHYKPSATSKADEHLISNRSAKIAVKWIKQHLRIKAFYGTSPNAVKTQIWIAISIYVLVALVKRELRLELSLNEILQILSIALFEKSPIDRVFTEYHTSLGIQEPCNQLSLFDL